jgi:HK97 family phage major capsid protein
MEELKRLLEEQKKTFEDFKALHARELAEVKAKGTANEETVAAVAKANTEISRQQKQIDELQKAAGRIGATGAPSEMDATKAAHRKAFDGYMRKGVKDDLADLQVKSLQTTVDGDGGFAIPEELERSVGSMERALTPMEGEVSSITAGAETYEKLFTDGMAASGWVGETDARPDTATPTLASFKPFYGELYANPSATQKMLDDAFFNVEAWLAAEVAEKFAQDLDLAIVSGDGVKKPKGILAYVLAATGDAARAYGTIEKKHSGVAGSFTGNDLIDLTHLLRPGYRQGAKWAMAGTTVAYCRKFKDAASGQYLWQPGLGGGQPATLLGYTIVEDENIPVVAAAANAVLFANFKRAYKLVNLRGIRVLRDPFTNKPKIQFYTTKRVGGGVEDTRAVKVLTLSI